MIRAAASSVLIALFGSLVACQPCDPDQKPGPAAGKRIQRGSTCSLKFEDFFLKHQSDELYLIDARHPWFYQQGHIPGALNLPKGDTMEQSIQAMAPEMRRALEQGKSIVVYCNGFGCHTARTVSRAITKKGFNVQVFSGGWKAWKKSELPIESTSQSGNDLTTQPAS
jgi:3-mercaptopyruvate sulfurtransferase SseA